MSPLAEKIIELHGRGLDRIQIAERAGCSRVWAWVVLKKHGVDMTPRGRYARKAPASPQSEGARP